MSAPTQTPLPAPRRRFTRAEFHRMAEMGLFGDGERLELVDGEIIPRSPQGPKHISATRRTARQMRRMFGEERWSIREEKALALPNESERYPDIVVAAGGDAEYDDRLAEARDVVLIIEIADTTLRTDRQVKGPEHAAAGISEDWIVNLPDRRLEIYRQPAPDGYGQQAVLLPSEQTRVPAADKSALVTVADLLPLR